MLLQNLPKAQTGHEHNKKCGFWGLYLDICIYVNLRKALDPPISVPNMTSEQ